MPISKLMVKFGEKLSFPLIFEGIDGNLSIQAGTLNVMSVEAPLTKSKDEALANQATSEEIELHNKNAILQEKLLQEQKEKMQQAKESNRIMTENMQKANLAPMPEEIAKRDGKQWPLKMSYQKVETNIRDF